MPARARVHPDDRRALVLDRAARLLASEGAAALTMRRLAREVDASTQVLYTLFESKEGLVDALIAEGFARFGEALSGVEHEDPWLHLRALGLAYRAFALENADYYALLWSAHRPLDADDKPPGGDAAWNALVTAVARVLGALDRPARDVEPMALAIWSAAHGFVSLELAGVDGGAARYAQLLDLCAAGIAGSPTVRAAREALDGVPS